ncbi:hypothetical protein A2715_01135 [Candidatus Woesebacteria bacterium RIFCSPHIGHO2_01_FULL_39_32]|uniref:DUF4349 domain-containing protein n=1 Tax=Candidatus Woesebacteria bacterium RIFCSPLOWO2_01_FULL_39_25 TaxID=1802521 RepID=A0A1F8BID1_9BACT|nr:MAG: hypothetical protein A2124_05310 [Candidatus Woesebacteria bacterium GWB1_37_5]OGM24511.1 MAG: hypothetical protein A2715_01135 [Candidatus Woesebacteria bacterium RIFCSPHIGHO2_01_FULL_39_32]OGM38861.1 MAG: hypothetical protein A3F01_03730 [Candidatus Woesebacteria bacterium RIFCSPHIGHO2_12_FULL_38_11]OGM63817.1 MAG: hypothetical protein A2893_02470 [Candidatus Woesebacteria bacterium RIFCSPLOWO2_01_FULL_39_25]
MKIIEWVKHNKFLTVVLLVVSYFLLNLVNIFFGADTLSLDAPSMTKQNEGVGLSPLAGAPVSGIGRIGVPDIYPPTDYSPQPDVKDRLVVQESNLSLLVEDVTDIRNKIVSYAQQKGGYMVSSNVSNPQDAPTATVVVRVPSKDLEEALDYFHSLSVKVVSENLVGQDVTDQYVDIDTRIAQLERTKARLETILDQATQITEITNLTQQILNYQNQIDALKGQQDALEKNAQLAKLTIYLSTDEIALPYQPSETFRPGVIFKLAVRSLVGTLRGMATLGIWVGVYAVIWLPALILFVLLRRWLKKRKSQPKL